MAIIDTTCHSGSTLALADDNTCVISGTGPNHYSYTNFSQSFTAAMIKGMNLEEIFLQVRAMGYTAGFPMISTYLGQAVNSILYEKITPFLYYSEVSAQGSLDLLSPFLQTNHSDYHQCVADKNFVSLIATINLIEELNTITKNIWIDDKNKRTRFREIKNIVEKL